MNKKEYAKEYKRQYRKKMKKVEMSFTPENHKRFKKIAKTLGYGDKTGTVVKEFALAYLDNRFIYPNDLKDQLNELTFLIRNIANNVNQLAHNSNIQRDVLNQYEILDHIKKMDEIVKQFVNEKIINYDNKKHEPKE
jgi:hypothetical protein